MGKAIFLAIVAPQINCFFVIIVGNQNKRSKQIVSKIKEVLFYVFFFSFAKAIYYAANSNSIPIQQNLSEKKNKEKEKQIMKQRLLVIYYNNSRNNVEFLLLLLLHNLYFLIILAIHVTLHIPYKKSSHLFVLKLFIFKKQNASVLYACQLRYYTLSV